jgi:hypothetical protein
LREKGKNEVIQCGRKVMSLVAKDYGYKGQEIAGYLGRDPAVITSHLREREKFESEVEKLHEILRTKKS